MGVTFSSGSTFQNATSIKVSKFIYGETTNSSENILDILSSKQILIVDVEDQDNYAIYNSGTVTQDGSSDFYDKFKVHQEVSRCCGRDLNAMR